MERLHLSRASTTLTAAIIAIAMSVMFFLVPSTANAATQEPDDPIPAAVQGMDAYLYRSADGIIVLDESSARQAGYSSASIDAIESNLTGMNEMISDGAISDDTFTVTLSVQTTRAGGQSKIVRYWWGLVEVYLNSSEARRVADVYDNLSTAAQVLSGILKKYSLAAQAAAVVYAVSAYQFRKAASGNRGIVITMSPNVDTGLYTYWVISQ